MLLLHYYNICSDFIEQTVHCCLGFAKLYRIWIFSGTYKRFYAQLYTECLSNFGYLKRALQQPWSRILGKGPTALQWLSQDGLRRVNGNNLLPPHTTCKLTFISTQLSFHYNLIITFKDESWWTIVMGL